MNLLYVAVVAAFLADPGAAISCIENKCTAIGLQNPLCSYVDPNPSPVCGKVISWGLSQDEIVEIMTTHNNMRRFVAQGEETQGNPGPQPPAESMKIMVWDQELAILAQRWVNQCNFTFAPCVDVDRFPVGQIGGRYRTNAETINKRPHNLLQSFYNQVKDFDAKQVHKFGDTRSISYTQMIWANTTKIGCGKILYKDFVQVTHYFLMCFYGPKGNNKGEPVYIARKD